MNTDAQAVVDAVCTEFHVERAALLGTVRTERVSWPRMVAYYVLREHLGWMLHDIGTVFGRDHSTVHHGIQRVSGRCRVARVDRELVQDVIAQVEVLRAESVPEQASNGARAAIEDAIARIDALVADALTRRAVLVAALATIDPIVRVA